MKRLLTLAITAVFLMTPLSLLGKTAISDSDLDNVTAEAGASVAFNNVTVNSVSLAVLSFGDPDGFTGYTTAGYMGANAFTMTGSLSVVNGTAIMDVGTSGAVTALDLILPTITLGTVNVTSTMSLSSAKTLASGQILGNLNMMGFSTRMTGEVMVFSHAAP